MPGVPVFITFFLIRKTFIMDYFPRTKSARQPWLRHINNELAIEAANLGVPADETAVVLAQIQEVLDRNAELEAAVATVRKAKSALDAADKIVEVSLRKFAKRLKSLPLYKPETGKSLGIVTTTVHKSLVDFKPSIYAVETGGFVQIFFVKKKVRSVNIYCKMPGETVFTLVATAVESPYIDTRPPSTAGIAELRQYYVMGVVKNAEVGQRSEIVAVSYSG